VDTSRPSLRTNWKYSCTGFLHLYLRSTAHDLNPESGRLPLRSLRAPTLAKTAFATKAYTTETTAAQPPPPPLPRSNRTSLVPPLVLSGHAASLTPYRLCRSQQQTACHLHRAPSLYSPPLKSHNLSVSGHLTQPRLQSRRKCLTSAVTCRPAPAHPQTISPVPLPRARTEPQTMSMMSQRDVSAQYGRRDETCPVSTEGGIEALPAGSAAEVSYIHIVFPAVVIKRILLSKHSKGRSDETCPVSTGGGTRRVQSVREGGGRARTAQNIGASPESSPAPAPDAPRAPCHAPASAPSLSPAAAPRVAAPRPHES
jgi:hypothetical protein